MVGLRQSLQPAHEREGCALVTALHLARCRHMHVSHSESSQHADVCEVRLYPCTMVLRCGSRGLWMYYYRIRLSMSICTVSRCVPAQATGFEYAYIGISV